MFVVTPTGLEPVASRLGISRSILMSYGAIFIIINPPKVNLYLLLNIFIEQLKITKYMHSNIFIYLVGGINLNILTWGYAS